MRLVTVLTLVCVMAALVLGAVYKNTAPLIAAQKEKETQQALKQALPDADKFIMQRIDDEIYYEGHKKERLAGYVITVKAEGYSGDIEIMVGLDKKGAITGVEILTQQETPGLGARCIEVKYGEKTPWFTGQFKQKKAEDLTLENIETITGATITTEAIIDAIKESVDKWGQVLNLDIIKK